MAKALTINIYAPMLFMTGFYSCLIGAKVLLALLVGKSRRFLNSMLYLSIMRMIGVALIMLAGILMLDGLRLLQMVG